METDTTIRKTLLGLIKANEILKTKDIAVDVNQGVVTLKGCVRNMREKREAERLTKYLREVRAVALDLQVECKEADDDTRIAAEIAEAFVWDPRLAGERISVAVDNGWVTLDGEVDDYCGKVAAFNAVNDIEQVKGISNRITVRVQTKYQRPLHVTT